MASKKLAPPTLDRVGVSHTKLLGYAQHLVADRLPMMHGEAFERLVDSMKTLGFDATQPVIMLDGVVIDGRNRLRAAKEAGVTPVFREYAGELGTPTMYILATNLARRDLTLEDRALIVAHSSIRATFEREARERKLAGQRSGGRGRKLEDTRIPKGTADALAKIANVSPMTIKNAIAVQKHAPELADEVRAGRTSLTAAAKQARERQPNARSKPEPKKATPTEQEIQTKVSRYVSLLARNYPRHKPAIVEALRSSAKELV